MKKLIFSSFNFAPPFLGPTLNNIQEGIDSKDEVTFLTCSKSFDLCGFNTHGFKYMCDLCNYRIEKYSRLISGNYTTVSLQNIIQPEDKELSRQFISGISQFNKHIVYENFDIGEAVFSSYISKTKDKDFQLQENKEIIKRLGLNSLQVYLAARRYLANEEFESVYIFNGRWDYYRSVFRAAESLGIPCTIYENFREGGFLQNYLNQFPHNLGTRELLIKDFWHRESNVDKKREIAKKFFQDKKKGVSPIHVSYIKNQQRNYLPETDLTNKKQITLFMSSEDEFAAVGKEYDNPYFEDQTEGVEYVSDLLSKMENIHLTVRMHPNHLGVNLNYLNRIYKLDGKYPNVSVVKPDSKVDSYALLQSSEKVITFGSSIGVEANYWGKPVILLGKTFYSNLDIAYSPSDRDDIKRLVESELDPKPVLNAEMVGYFFMKFGEKAKYYSYSLGGDYFFKENKLNQLPAFYRNYLRVLKKLAIKN